MNKLLKQIKELNEVYHIMKKQYDILEKMFHNHSSIKQKIIFSEQILNQAYMLIRDKFEEAEAQKQFNKIIGNIKDK